MPTTGRVSAEPLAWVLRFHEDPEGSYEAGSPYHAVTTVTVDEAGVATLRGLARDHFSVSDWRAVNDALFRLGASSVSFTRKRNGMVRPVSVSVTPPTAQEKSCPLKSETCPS